jgi:pyrroline-5-carboxylate reductase
MSTRVGFLGAGKMSQALIAGFIHAKQLKAQNIWAFSPSKETQKKLKALKINVAKSPEVLLKETSIIFLGVKPQVLPGVLFEINPFIKNHLLVSIAAGFPIKKIENALSPKVKVIRVMPNTPTLVGAGAAAICKNNMVSLNEFKAIKVLFDSVGVCISVPESKFHAVTALSGSGPAFVFRFIQELINSAASLGLTAAEAKILAVQTAYGSAKLAKSSGVDLETLIAQVSSPNGTTVAGRKKLEDGRLSKVIFDTLTAAKARSIELAQN